MKLRWIDPHSFDADEYKFYENVENGDLNWIFPKIIAFSTPFENSDNPVRRHSHSPKFYLPIFEKWGVSLVIRLCRPEYDSRVN